MKMFSNNTNSTTDVTTVLTNNLTEFENDLIVHKTGVCNSSNSLLSSTTTSIPTNNRSNGSPPSVNQHRISIQVKVEESSASSGEENSNGTVNTNNHIGQQVSIANQWPNSCIYTCNFSTDPRRYLQGEDKCVEQDIETKLQENESNNLAQRERLFCFGSAFSTNTPQNNSQQYSFADNLVNHCPTKQNSLRDDGLNGLNSNSVRLNSLQDSVINNTNNDEKSINLSIISELDPIYWEWEQVRHWLELLVKENQLQDIDINRFNHFSGRELCSMTREDFRKLTDSFNGEQVYKRLQSLRQSVAFKDKQNQSIGSLTPLNTSYSDRYYSQNFAQNPRNSVTNSRHFRTSDTTYNKWGSHSPSPSQGYHHNAISGMTKPSALDSHHSHLRNMQDPYQIFGQTSSRLASQGSGQIQLWQFLLELLSDPANSNCITWEGTNGEFKLSDPDEVARRWGERKSKPNMNYDKLSRALRYYYDKNIMTKVHGKRYAYKFDFQGLAQATQPTAADPSAYKAAYQSADLFMHPPHGYHHPTSAAKHLNFAAAVHSAGISSSTSGGIFPPTSPYWTSTGAAANLYSNIAAASATHHASMPHHHHPSHVTSHIGSYYA